MKDLFIIIKKKYLEEIKNGIKSEEFRTITPYWTKRLVGKEYRNIIFQAGYKPDCERLTVSYQGFTIKTIQHDFFGSNQIEVYAIKVQLNLH